ncbi:arsenic metallochaperone ArsD family protein [Rothia sp. LK2588]|uniref:arsenic metallochaperone ArsD family protein n=1 Tax=Rothia sp. LK2588 TaxID=3114369 RepID=UPI0034CF4ADA
MTQTETPDYAELEVFIPGPGENEDDPKDVEREEFLATAQQLLDAGHDIAVYSTDSYPSAFTDCAPVAEQIEMAGAEVLPILLVDGTVKVSYNYPDREQLERFSKARTVKQKKLPAAAAACGGGASDAPVAPTMEPAGFAAKLAGVTEKPAGGPEIGMRRNLMGGDFGQGLPGAGESATSASANPAQGSTPNAGGCGCGGCGCS